mmetsp:Transcript_15831/g.36654  ORF Transcript_15831/g.36654 Transcript_15831/m.36654 type:complete len:234 (-) Transcript_15831:46-747(-)
MQFSRASSRWMASEYLAFHSPTSSSSSDIRFRMRCRLAAALSRFRTRLASLRQAASWSLFIGTSGSYRICVFFDLLTSPAAFKFFLLIFLHVVSPVDTFRFLGGFFSIPLPSAWIVELLVPPSALAPSMAIFASAPSVVDDATAAAAATEPLAANAATPFTTNSFSERCDWMISLRRFLASAGSFDIGVMLARFGMPILSPSNHQEFNKRGKDSCSNGLQLVQNRFGPFRRFF